MNKLIAMIIMICLSMTMISAPCLAFEEMSKGSKGDAVVKLQNKLNELGYSVGKADGDFGGKTEKAIKQFQKDNGLEETGVVDDETFSVLFSDNSNASSSDTPTSDIPTSNDALFLVEGADGYGYCNANGEVIIPCQWAESTAFSGGLAAVRRKKDGSWGCINTDGELVIPCDFKQVYISEYGYAIVQKNVAGYWYYVYSSTGERVFPEAIEGADRPCVGPDGFAYKSKSDGTVHFYSFETKVDTQLEEWDTVTGYSEGFLVVSAKGKEDAYIDPKRAYKLFPFSDGLARILNKFSLKVGYVDIEGTIVIPCTRDPDSEDFSEGFTTAVKWGSAYGYINKTCDEVIRFQYDYADAFHEGLAAVRSRGHWGFIDKNGNQVVDFLYNEVDNFSNGYSLVSINGKSFYIDKEGNPAFLYNIDDSPDSLPSKEDVVNEVQRQAQQKKATRQSNNQPAKKEALSESACKTIATNYLKKYLKNPSSLQVHSVTSTKTADSYTFIFDYSAMNSFGGYTRSTYICVVDNVKGEVTAAYSD